MDVQCWLSGREAAARGAAARKEHTVTRPTSNDIAHFPTRFGPFVAFLSSFILFLIAAVGVVHAENAASIKVCGAIAVGALVTMTRVSRAGR